MATIIIADDHFAVRVGVKMIVQEAVGKNCQIDSVGDGKSIFTRMAERKYDLLIMDLNMPGDSGVSLISKALAIQADLKIIVLTIHKDEHFAKPCLIAGAYAFINKAMLEEELKKAIHSVFDNRKYVSEQQKEQFLHNMLMGAEEVNPFSKLSERERKVASLFLKGLGVLEVANTLAISPSTSSSFKGRIFRKLGVNSFIELSDMSRRFGFTDDESFLY